jgi:hypothetical protein
MAITKRTIVNRVEVLSDGRIRVRETVEFYEGGIINGTLEGTGELPARIIDVGDDVTSEDPLIKDVVNGNLHTAARKTAREQLTQ